MYWKYCLCWKKDLELNRDSRILWEFRMHNKIIQSPHGLPKQANCQYLMWLWFLKVPGIPSIKAICILCFGLWWHMVKDPWRGLMPVARSRNFMLQVVLPKIYWGISPAFRICAWQILLRYNLLPSLNLQILPISCFGVRISPVESRGKKPFRSSSVMFSQSSTTEHRVTSCDMNWKSWKSKC